MKTFIYIYLIIILLFPLINNVFSKSEKAAVKASNNITTIKTHNKYIKNNCFYSNDTSSSRDIEKQDLYKKIITFN